MIELVGSISAWIFCRPIKTFYSFHAVSGSAWLLRATKFPITLFNTILRFSFLCSTWTEYNQALMPASLPRGLPPSSLLRFHLHG